MNVINFPEIENIVIVYLNDAWHISLLSAVCDFEDDGLCGFDQDLYDDFDWIRNSGGTNSTGTGPTNDHTYGTTKGKHFSPNVHL